MENNNNGFQVHNVFEDDEPQNETIDISSKSESYIEESREISSSSKSSGKKKYKKKKKGNWWQRLTTGKKVGVIAAAVALVLLISGFIYIYPLLNYNYDDKIEKKTSSDLGFDGKVDKEIINVALFGIDTRDDTFEGRSDSMMVLSINTKTKTVKCISLMRDTFVPIDKNGKTTYGKINSAYFNGGAELGIKTVNQNFGLDISEYATINFYGMVEIIDAVGGIECTVTEDELKWHGNDNPNLNNCMDEICAAKGLNPNNYHISTTGPQHMNGVQAVAYARVRHCKSTWGTNDDFGRTDRQRYVMSQLFSKATQMSKTDYIKFAKALIPCSKTSLDMKEIVNLAINVLLEHPTFEQYRVPQDSMLMPFNGGKQYGSCVYFDLEYAKEIMHAIIYDETINSQEALDNYTANVNPVRKNNWFSGNTASTGTTSAAQKPANAGASSAASSGTSSEEPKKPEPTESEASKPEPSSSSESAENGNSQEPT